MMISKCFYTSILLLSLACNSLFGQTNVNESLDKLSIGSIVKDHYGRIWLTTFSELYCYDGSQLIEFNSRSNPKLFTNTRITGMVFNKTQKKLVLTTGKGVVFFDPDNFKGELLDASKLKLKDLKNGLFFPSIDSDGNVWCTNNEGDLITIDKFFGSRIIHVNLPVSTDLLSRYGNHSEYASLNFSNGNIYFGTARSEVCKYDIKKDEAYTISIEDRAISGIYSNGKEVVYSDFNGVHFRNENDTTIKSDIPAHLVGFLYQDDNQEIWYVLNKTQIFKINEYHESELVYELDPEQVNKHKVIRALLIDKDKIWIATERGLILINKPLKAFYKIFDKLPGYSNVELSSRGIVHKNDSIVICGGYNYLASYNQRSNEVKLLATKSMAQSLIPYGLCVTGDSLWIASEGSGLKLFDLSTLQIKKIQFKNSFPVQYFINGGLIKCVTKIDSFIYLGEYGLLGLYNLRSRVIIDSYHADWRYKWAREKTIGINQILELGKDELLFVAVGDVMITNKQLKILNKINADDLRSAITEFTILNVMVDDKKRFWISTDRAGICLYDRNKQECKWFTTQNGLSDNTVYYSLQSNDGRIWVATNYGLSVIDPITASINNYFEKDGLASNEFNTNSYLKALNGDLYLGGMKGVTRIIPTLLNDRKEPVRFMITAIHMANLAGPDSVIQTNLANLNEVILPNHSRFLKVQFSLMNYSEGNKYAFRLIGLDTAWVNLGSSNSVVFNSLTPGSYTLQIRAWNERGEQAKEIISFPIVSEQIFYKKAWFIVLCSILFVALTGVVFYTLYKIKLRALHQMAEMRLRIASDLHDQVGGLLNKTASQAELVKVNSENDSHTLGKIADNSRIALNSMRDILWNLDPRNDNPNSLVDRMSEYAHKMLEDTNSYKLNLGDLRKVEITHEQRQTINTVFAEAINNIVKHAPNEKVEVNAIVNSKSIELIVTNTGKFSIKEISTGQGIKNMKMRIEKIGGTFSMEVDENVKISFVLPLKANSIHIKM